MKRTTALCNNSKMNAASSTTTKEENSIEKFKNCSISNKNIAQFKLVQFVESKTALDHIPDHPLLTFEYLLDKLAKGCPEFRTMLRGGEERVMKVEASDISGGFTSRLFRCKIEITKAKKLKEKSFNGVSGEENEQQQHNEKTQHFSAILKVFSTDRFENILEFFIGKERLDEIKIKMDKEELKVKRPQPFENESSERLGDEELGVEMAEKPKIIGKLNEKMTRGFEQMHINECKFYQLFNDIDGDQNNKQNAPLPLPKVYFTRHTSRGRKKIVETSSSSPYEEGPEGLVLMEDLCESTSIVPQMEGLSEEQIYEVVKHIAQMHAFMSRPCAIEKWKKEFLTIEEIWADDMFKYFDEAIFEQIKELGEKFLLPIGRLRKVMENIKFSTWVDKKCEEEIGVPEMLVHNDLWLNNILWSNKEPGHVLAFIDWQLCTRGTPMIDVTRLMLASVQPDLRHKIEKSGKLLEIYLTELNAKLAQFGLPPTNYGLKELQRVYNLALIEQVKGRIFEVAFFERGTPKTEPERDAKMACIKMRAAAGIKDALRIMEEEAPEWLLDDGE